MVDVIYVVTISKFYFDNVDNDSIIVGVFKSFYDARNEILTFLPNDYEYFESDISGLNPIWCWDIFYENHKIQFCIEQVKVNQIDSKMILEVLNG